MKESVDLMLQNGCLRKTCVGSLIELFKLKKYALSVDQAEAIALEKILSECDSFEMIFYQVQSTGHSDASRSPDVLYLYDTNSNGRITCSEAKAHGIAPVSSKHPAYSYMNDSDGDGIVCE
ncbi:excalibur calcium-binding domain-containing protein [Pseudoalteromonas sp. Hal056]|uniref:excalibur calcium-binding domain-containing protein n=2 Tax=unclassified Pseudoalteromonas TaxID=194690 RepID=UPI00301E4B4B